jgi:hypothetical protein
MEGREATTAAAATKTTTTTTKAHDGEQAQPDVLHLCNTPRLRRLVVASSERRMT